MAITPFFVVCLSFDNPVVLALGYVLFTVAAITDYYDGKIARERNLITNFGKLIDPVADKILVSAAFIMMMTLPELEIPAWTIIVVLAREFFVTGARSLAASEGAVLQANVSGKTKAVLQMVFIFVFLFLAILGRFLEWTGFVLMDLYTDLLRLTSFWAIIFVAVYTVYSGVNFLWVNRYLLSPTFKPQ